MKDLVLDPQLMKPLDHFTGASFLKVSKQELKGFMLYLSSYVSWSFLFTALC